MSYWVQFILALPLALAGFGCFVWALLKPGSVGLLRLSIFAFAAQFCIGPLINMFTRQVPLDSAPADIVLTFGTIYLFYLAVVVVAIIWRSRLDPILMVRDRGLSHEHGIFACLTEASLRASLVGMIFFYALVTGIRYFMLVKYGVGISGTGTEERTMAIPYAILAVYKTFYSLGLMFVYVAITRIAYRRPGTFWYVLIIVAEVLNTFIKGRRRLFSLAIMMFFALLMKHGRMKLRHAVLAGIGLLVLWRVAFPFFYNLRTEWQRNPDSPVTAWVQVAWMNTLTGGVYGESERVYKRSFTTRLNALTQNYYLAAKLNGGTPPAYGAFLKSSIIVAVPRFLFPGKLAMYTDDQLMGIHFHTVGDLMSNLPAFAMADFGLLGGLIYGALFALSIRFFELMLKVLFQRTPVGAMALFSSMAFDVILQVENPPGSFVIALRLAVMIFLLMYAWSSVFGSSQPTAAGEYNAPEPVPR